MDAGLCELCNPLELSQPSATQMHGIAAVGIIAFVALLAVLARVGMSTSGPFAGSVTGIEPVAGGLAVTLSVANEGRNDAAVSCSIREARPRMGSAPHIVEVPLIRAGQTISWTATVTIFGTEPVALIASCPP